MNNNSLISSDIQLVYKVPSLYHKYCFIVSLNQILNKSIYCGTSLVTQWLRLCSQCGGPGFNPWSGNQITHAATKSLHTTTKDPTFHNENHRSHVLQLRHDTATYIHMTKKSIHCNWLIDIANLFIFLFLIHVTY